MRSRHVLIVDVDGKVVDHLDGSGDLVIGFTDKTLTNARAFKLLKECLAGNGLTLGKKDRIYRLNPAAMKNKLKQFGIEETRDN